MAVSSCFDVLLFVIEDTLVLVLSPWFWNVQTLEAAKVVKSDTIRSYVTMIFPLGNPQYKPVFPLSS